MVDEDYLKEQEKGLQEFNEILAKLKAAIAERDVHKIVDFMNDLTKKQNEYEGLWNMADEQWPLVERALEEIANSKFGETIDSELVFEDKTIWLDDEEYIHISPYDKEED